MSKSTSQTKAPRSCTQMESKAKDGGGALQLSGNSPPPMKTDRCGGHFLMVPCGHFTCDFAGKTTRGQKSVSMLLHSGRHFYRIPSWPFANNILVNRPS